MPNLTRRAAVLGLLPAAGLLTATAPAAPAAPVPAGAGTKELDDLWADLAKDDLPACRALLRLSAKPKEAVPYLKARLRPLKIDADRVKKLLADLGSDKDEVWKAAFEEFEYLDPRLAIDLPTLMADVTGTPARQRLVAVLCGREPASLEGKAIQLRAVGNDGYNFSSDGGSWWAEHRIDRLNVGWGNTKKHWTRAVRAVTLLEHVGTPAAVAVLQDLAAGHPDAQPTKAAADALKRLSGGK